MQVHPTQSGVIYCKHTYTPAVPQQLINPALYVLEIIALCAGLHYTISISNNGKDISISLKQSL